MERMKEHDKLGRRLGIILTRLNTGERLHLMDLAREFNVSERTLQRDFNDRLNYLPIKRDGSTYYIEPSYLGRRTTKHMASIIKSMGLEQLFPTNNAFSDNVCTSDQSPYLFKNIRLEPITDHAQEFSTLSQAIKTHQFISFFSDGHDVKDVEPYKLVNDHGIWYLVAVINERLTAIKLTTIKDVVRYKETFIAKPEYLSSIEQQNIFWLSQTLIDVIIQVDSHIAAAFLDTSPLPKQQLLKRLDDGSLLISSQVCNSDEILPQLKAWLPKIDILSPDIIKLELVKDLEAGLKRVKSYK